MIGNQKKNAGAGQTIHKMGQYYIFYGSGQVDGPLNNLNDVF